MLPLLLVIISTSNIFILSFIGYYLIQLHRKEKHIEEKERATDNNYHHVVDEALSQERKIIDDATTEADQIITGAQYITRASKDEVNNAVKSLVDDIQKEGTTIARAFTEQYAFALKQLTGDSLKEFQTIMLELQTDLKKQISAFHEAMLPEIEKKLELYRQTRLKEIDQEVGVIVQKASQEIFNKSISLADHQSLVIESLEKAKKEGIFD